MPPEMAEGSAEEQQIITEIRYLDSRRPTSTRGLIPAQAPDARALPSALLTGNHLVSYCG